MNRKTEIKPAYDCPEEIRQMFQEYTKMVVENQPDFAGYLKKQNFEEELEHLNEKYGMPKGRLYMAWVDGEPACCIGLRRIDEKNCEMKRLYVRPKFRGQKLAEQMTEKLIADAKEIGYQNMLLDTFAFLTGAIQLYKKLGFYEIASYNQSPMENLKYFRLELKKTGC